MIIICIVIGLVTFLSAFQLGMWSHHRKAIDYKGRWLEATKLLGAGATKPQPPDPDAVWKLRIDSNKVYRDNRLDVTVDATFMYAERSSPRYQKILLDSFANASGYRERGARLMSTPEVFSARRKACVKVIDEMNEDAATT